MSNSPFIHLVRSPIHCYIYDVNTNRIVLVSEETYCFLQEAKRKKSFMLEEAHKDVQTEIDKLVQQGFLSSMHPKKMKHPESDFLDYHLSHNIEHMILQVTQQCNFRCSYCTYGSKDFESQRSHSQKQMSYSLAKKAIDFFAAHSRDQMSILIGFYGGEPLLEFDLIKQIVLYAEAVFEGKELNFGMTTNGSLINESIVKFLSKHKFDITISLDGPPKVHNRSRKFAANGKGTFSSIVDNIRFIKEFYPEFHKRLRFNIVIDPRFSVENLYKLFDTDEIFKDTAVRSTLIDDFFSTEKVVATSEYLATNAHEEFLAYLALFGKYPIDNVSSLVLHRIRDFYRQEKDNYIPRRSLSDETSHGGPCIPGQRLLFVNVDGDFFQCERVSETSSAMKIGDINSGFYMDKVNALLNICQLTEKQCKNCWAITKCATCARVCDNDGELSGALKLSECKKARAIKEEEMEYYIMIQEMNEIYGGTELV